MQILQETEQIKFAVDTAFDSSYLLPVGRYMLWKLENRIWDDYNELYHATAFVENLKTYPDIWLHIHLFLKKDTISGVLFIVGGKISTLESRYQIEKEAESLLLKYFHITVKGQGYGSRWLKTVIMPYYKQKYYKKILVSSSHTASFPFYQQLGKQIASLNLLLAIILFGAIIMSAFLLISEGNIPQENKPKFVFTPIPWFLFDPIVDN
jgi:hypothetical protein